MPETRYFNALRNALSNERLSKYKRDGDLSDAEAIGRYFYNICLCEALYPALQGLEVALRNNLDSAVSNRYGDAWISPTSYVLDGYRRDDVAEAIERLEREEKGNYTSSDLISALGFGFWVGLLSKNYETGNTHGTDLWPFLLKQVFPNLERRRRTRQTVANFFTKMRRLRNRVFHHEPIWHYKDLEQQHAQILQGIIWMCPELCDTLKLFDRFPEVYRNGPTPCHAKLEGLLDSIRSNDNT